MEKGGARAFGGCSPGFVETFQPHTKGALTIPLNIQGRCHRQCTPASSMGINLRGYHIGMAR